MIDGEISGNGTLGPITSHSQFVTASERLFADYLDRHGLTWTSEPKIGEHRPDFVVHTEGGDVACEVKEWTKGTLSDERVCSEGPEQFCMPIRRKLRDSYGQADSCHSAGLPFVLVLDATTGPASCDALTVFAAMMGPPIVVFPVDSEGSGLAAFTQAFLDGESRRGMKPGPSNERYSALAVLSSRNPTAAALESYLHTRRAEWAGLSTAEAMAVAFRVTGEATDAGVYDPELEAEPGLDAYHNPYAGFPVDPGVFGNRTTRQWRMNPGMELFHVGERRDNGRW